jgi:hypothetical protein
MPNETVTTNERTLTCKLCNVVKAKKPASVNAFTCKECVANGCAAGNKCRCEEAAKLNALSNDEAAKLENGGKRKMSDATAKKERTPRGETRTAYIDTLLKAGEKDIDVIVKKTMEKFPGLDEKKVRTLAYVRRSNLKKKGLLPA